MKNIFTLLIFSIALFACGGMQNAGGEALLTDTLKVIDDADFIKEYMGFRKEVMDKGKEVKSRYDDDRLTDEEFEDLKKAYGSTQETFNNILNGIVVDLVVDIDKLAKNEVDYQNKYTKSFTRAIDNSKSSEDFLGMFAMYDDTDSAILATLVSIAGPMVMKGIKSFVRNSKKFQSFTKAKLSPPVIKKFGFPDFEDLEIN